MRALVPIVFVACFRVPDPVPSDTGAPSAPPAARAWFADADGDGHGDPQARTVAARQPVGHVATGDDCDDRDPQAHPGATERPGDGVDQDCDGRERCHRDDDGDGAGHPEALVEVPVGACGPGTAPTPDDCDDTDPTVHPTAPEVCNERDDDCDGLVDDDDDVQAALAFRDDDGDGVGRGPGVPRCDRVGWAAVPGDCDDGDPAVHAGADEVCNGRDDDCDTRIDDEDDDVRAPLAWRDDDGDGAGAGQAEGRCLPAAGWAAAPGDCDDTDPAVHPDAVEVCDDGVDQDCAGPSATCGLDERPPDGHWAPDVAWSGLGGLLVAGVDADGDGLRDLFVGAVANAAGAGADVLVVPGATLAGHGSPPLTTFAPVRGWRGAVAADPIGGQVVVLEAPDDAATFTTVARPPLPLAPGSAADTTPLGPLAAPLPGPTSLAVHTGPTGSTAVAVGSGGPAQWMRLHTRETGVLASEVALHGVAVRDDPQDGWTVIGLGDDGVARAWHHTAPPHEVSTPMTTASTWWQADTAHPGTRGVLAWSDASGGDATLLVGLACPPDDACVGPEVVFLVDDGGRTLTRIVGADVGARWGAAVAALGDVDGDGHRDWGVGAPGADTAWVLYGPVPGGAFSTDDLGAQMRAHRLSGAAGSSLGTAVASPGDLDGDGRAEIAIGAPGEERGVLWWRGRGE